MANANTDQYNRAADAAPIVAPIATNTIVFQRSTAVAQQRGAGNSTLQIPGQFKATSQKVLVRAFGRSTLASVTSQTVTIAINGVNAAGTSVVLATSGAIAAATQAGATVGWYLECQFLVNAIPSVTVPGTFSGVYGATLIAATVLSNQPNFTRSNISGTSAAQGLDENQFFTVSIAQAQTDATAVHVLEQLSSELL